MRHITLNPLADHEAPFMPNTARAVVAGADIPIENDNRRLQVGHMFDFNSNIADDCVELTKIIMRDLEDNTTCPILEVHVAVALADGGVTFCAHVENDGKIGSICKIAMTISPIPTTWKTLVITSLYYNTEEN
jgi:hypothetical protein